MAMTPEAKVKAGIKKILTELGCYFTMPIGGAYSNAGTPDFLVCYKGRFIGVEAKAGKGKTTALQDLHLQKIRDAGGVALVIYETDLPKLKSILENVCEEFN